MRICFRALPFQAITKTHHILSKYNMNDPDALASAREHTAALLKPKMSPLSIEIVQAEGELESSDTVIDPNEPLLLHHDKRKTSVVMSLLTPSVNEEAVEE